VIRLAAALLLIVTAALLAAATPREGWVLGLIAGILCSELVRWAKREGVG
jgi:hypothetical protein